MPPRVTLAALGVLIVAAGVLLGVAVASHSVVVRRPPGAHGAIQQAVPLRRAADSGADAGGDRSTVVTASGDAGTVHPQLFDYAQLEQHEGHTGFFVRDRANHTTDEFIEARLLSASSPRALYFPKLLSDAECDGLIALGSNALQKSGVWSGGKNTVRSSYGTRLKASDALVKTIDRRIYGVFQREFKGTYAERLYLLRYDKGQFYKGHQDTFGGITGKAHATAKRNRAKEEASGKRRKPGAYLMLDRAVTLLLYLAGGVTGGNTSLPYLTPAAFTDPDATVAAKHSAYRRGKDDPCDATRFLNIAPRKGAAVAFYSLRRDGTEDATSVHMGCDVVDGTKWVATKWLMVPFYD